MIRPQAARNGMRRCVELLLESGADTQIRSYLKIVGSSRDDEGALEGAHTAFDFAKEFGKWLVRVPIC